MSLAAAVAAQGYAVISAPEWVRAAPSDPWGIGAEVVGERPRMVERQPIRAVTGGRTFASGRGPAPLHTDSQLFQGSPPHWQVLFCVQPARTGGDTLLLDSRDVLSAVEDTALSDALFSVQRRMPFVFGDIEGPTVAWAGSSVCFTGTPMPNDDVGHALALLYPSLPTTTLRLRAGEVLVVDNHRFLHGRTAFEGPRMLERILLWVEHPAPPLPALAARAQGTLVRPLDRAHLTLPPIDRARAMVDDMLRGVPPGVLAERHRLPEALLYVLRDQWARREL